MEVKTVKFKDTSCILEFSNISLFLKKIFKSMLVNFKVIV